ncbi:MAG: diaminopimelate decarboxylase [Gemmatimonadaceae bacterium]|nr:diaminopimelate decarboxylase [Gemmatimonadaceae bacterium]
MPGFARVGDTLHCEDVALEAIADAVGTPAYVYSAGTIRDRYTRLTGALAHVPHRVHYSLKANSSRGVLDLLRSHGSGADVVSGGELFRALRAGFRPEEIIFGGVGKTRGELHDAVAAGVLLINVESEGELRLLHDVAADAGRVAPVAIRVNPEITVEAAHAYIKTGEKGNKFGVPHDEVLELARLAHAWPHVTLLGLDMHVGSQLSFLEPYERGTERLLALCEQLRAEGVDTLRYLDVGGGLAVRYDAETPPDLTRFAEIMTGVAAASGLQLILEPGRFLVGDAAVLLTRVLYRKRSGGKEYVITDAGMTELLRPSHYNAYHRIEAVGPTSARVVADVVGPVCESGDFLALDRDVADVQPGELLAVHGAGAYGYAMAMNYNSRCRPAEVMVDGCRQAVITRRETYEDLVRAEVVVPNWETT